ncbi:MAG: hypothetical protein V1701_09225, partial [Planctomycetota bacterium]
LDANRKGIYVLAALKLYKLRHGAYPETLNKLAPEIISEVPIDHYSDKPFVYRVDKDNKLWLYSIGSDLKDDGGVDKRQEDIIISPK